MRAQQDFKTKTENVRLDLRVLFQQTQPLQSQTRSHLTKIKVQVLYCNSGLINKSSKQPKPSQQNDLLRCPTLEGSQNSSDEEADAALRDLFLHLALERSGNVVMHSQDQTSDQAEQGMALHTLMERLQQAGIIPEEGPTEPLVAREILETVLLADDRTKHASDSPIMAPVGTRNALAND